MENNLRNSIRSLLVGLTTLLAPSNETRISGGQRLPGGEVLEPRTLLAADGIVDVGSQPVGALKDKIVYTHAGHGWTADNLNGGQWSTQRGESHEIVEDLGNQDQMTFFVEYLFRAGATVVPLRPVGHQTKEVILDNDDDGVSFEGVWSDGDSRIYFGDAGDIPDRWAETSPVETAVARYRPHLPESGFYPVYSWTSGGLNRTSQLYRIHHTGGSTEVTINHRRLGNGLVYLGTYHFAAGTDGFVEISNRSDEAGRVVVADMVRFGNGMGDIDRGGGVSGKPREDEAGLYWIQMMPIPTACVVLPVPFSPISRLRLTTAKSSMTPNTLMC